MRFLSQDDVEQMPATEPSYVLRYGPDPMQFGELRLPESGGRVPLIVVLHGGCWSAEFASRTLTAPMASAITRLGIATWNLEFRRVGDPGGGWPNTLLDVAAGVDFARTLCTQFPLDRDNVCAVGNSAGGHLALWGAARHKLPPTSPLFSADPLPLRGAISLGGMGDLRRYQKESAICGGRIEGLLGATDEQASDRYDHASPIELLPLGVRQVMITGAHDTIVRPENSAAYVAAARQMKDDADLIVVEDAAHFEIIAPGSSSWPTVERAILDLAYGTAAT